MEKKNPVQSFVVFLISSHEVMKLKSFESGVSDVLPANAQNILSLVFSTYF